MLGRYAGRPTAALIFAVCLPALVAAAPSASPVADAAMRGDVDAVHSLLRQGADVNAAQGDGMTAMHWAARNDDSAMLEMLIYAGASPTAVTRIGDYTALHLAAKSGHAQAVEVLLRAGSSVDATTTAGGASALHFASAAGNLNAITALLDHGADVNARESTWGQTSLMFAAAANRVEAVDLLVQRGADSSITARVVDLPAFEERLNAQKEQRDRRIAALQAIDPEDSVEPVRPTPSREPLDATPAEPTAKPAPAAEAKPEPESEEAPSPPVAESAALEEEEDKEEAEGEPPDYHDLVGTHGGMTALLHAAREGHSATVQALLESEADVNLVNAGDRTSPLLIAVVNGHFDLAMYLLDQGADPTLASTGGLTPLYATIKVQWAPKSRYPQQYAYTQQRTGYMELLQALLDAGADPNVRLNKHLWHMSYNFHLLGVDSKGATPLWRAAYATDVAAMRLLVAHGADPNVPTQVVPKRRRYADSGGEDGKMDPSGLPPVPINGPAVYPIHAASGVGYGQGYAGNSHRHVPDAWLATVTYLMEELGADVNARDHDGYAPLHHAAARGDNELIRYLVEHGADPTVISRRGQTTVDMANGPVQRIQPFPETIALLESLGAENSHNCVSC